MDRISKMTYPTRLRGADLTASEYRVLMTIWTYSDEHMRKAYPSRARLATDCCMSLASVKRAVTALTAKGYLTIDARGGWSEGGNRANVYHLSLPARGGGVMGDPTVGSPVSRGGVASEPLSGPISDPVSDPPTPSSADDEDSSLRSPSPTGRRRLIDYAKTITTAPTSEDQEAAALAFLDAFEDSEGWDASDLYWNRGFEDRLHALVKSDGLDYGTGKWLGILKHQSSSLWAA